MTPLSADWNGLASVIPGVLQLGVIDYPFANPGERGSPSTGIPSPRFPSLGPVGGVSKIGEEKRSTVEDESELYIRWWQMSTFLPVLHYLKPPNAFNLREVNVIINTFPH